MFQAKGTAHAKSLRLDGNARREKETKDRKGKANKDNFLWGLISLQGF